MSAVLDLIAFVRACFRMFSNAAFASATRAVSRSPRLEQMDLELKDPKAIRATCCVMRRGVKAKMSAIGLAAARIVNCRSGKCVVVSIRR